MKKIWKRITALVLAGIMALTPTNYAYAANAGNAIAKGIDVSKHNGAINWASVAAAGYSFAFIKVGSTYSGVDPFFDYNIKGAQNAGLKVGVYIYSYATTVEQAQNEANLVIAWLSNYTVTFPVVYDIEDSCHKGMSPDQLQALINTFCMTVASAGYYPMVYSSKNWFNQRIGNVLFDTWVAQYADNLEYSGASFWQSSSSGVVPGVNSKVDIDYQFKDFSKLIISDGFVDRFGQTMFFSGYKMQRGWIDYNDTRYYLGADGFLQRNCWFADGSGTYFLSADGSISRGQTAILGQNYYFDVNGVMQTGWIDLPGIGRLYYSPLSGAMVQGWFTDTTGTYYLSTKDGHMLVGDVTINGNDYYFGADGVMQTGLVTKPDGNMYFYDAAGALVKNQQTLAGDIIYVSDKKGVVTPVPVVAPQPEAALPVQ
ncbi:MAG: hypothetical protein HDR12_10810 [Lachnospiraceae bacterium]|nr:hypothetical protein [Lachnospiraceae bacterium]